MTYMYIYIKHVFMNSSAVKIVNHTFMLMGILLHICKRLIVNEPRNCDFLEGQLLWMLLPEF